MALFGKKKDTSPSSQPQTTSHPASPSPAPASQPAANPDFTVTDLGKEHVLMERSSKKITTDPSTGSTTESDESFRVVAHKDIAPSLIPVVAKVNPQLAPPPSSAPALSPPQPSAPSLTPPSLSPTNDSAGSSPPSAPSV